MRFTNERYVTKATDNAFDAGAVGGCDFEGDRVGFHFCFLFR